MENVPSFNQLIQESIINNWDLDALTDYKGATLQFHDVARKIEDCPLRTQQQPVGCGLPGYADLRRRSCTHSS